MKRPDPETALKLYYTHTEINSAEIKQLFSCAGATATKLKQQVQKEMAKCKIRTWIPGNIDVKTAYEVWGIDVNRLEKQLVKLNKLKEQGVIPDD